MCEFAFNSNPPVFGSVPFPAGFCSRLSRSTSLFRGILIGWDFGGGGGGGGLPAKHELRQSSFLAAVLYFVFNCHY